MQLTTRIKALTAIFFLSVAVSTSWFIRSSIEFHTKKSYVQKALPERIRSFVSSFLWARADLYAHFEPDTRLHKTTSFESSSSTDILPLLQIIMWLSPEEISVHQLYARNLARYYDMPKQARKIIQHAIIYDHPQQSVLHELYASIAFIWLFDTPEKGNNLIAAKKYLKKAVSLIEKNSQDIVYSDPAFNTESYHILLSRIFLELEHPDMALKSWKKSGKKLDSPSRLADILLSYKNNPDLKSKDFQPDKSIISTTEIPEKLPATVHNCDDKSNCHSCASVHIDYIGAFRPAVISMLLAFTALIIFRPDQKKRSK